MMWYIHSSSRTSLLLWRADQQTFKVVQPGELAPMLTSYDYIIFDKKFKPILDKLSGQVNQKPITIIDNVKQQTWMGNFIEIEILAEVDQPQIIRDDNQGLVIRKFGREHVFVSYDLMNEFKSMGENDFDFTKGLRNFAGTGSR